MCLNFMIKTRKRWKQVLSGEFQLIKTIPHSHFFLLKTHSRSTLENNNTKFLIFLTFLFHFLDNYYHYTLYREPSLMTINMKTIWPLMKLYPRAYPHDKQSNEANYTIWPHISSVNGFHHNYINIWKLEDQRTRKWNL